MATANALKTLTAIGTSRNPVQETEFRNLLKNKGVGFKLVNGKAVQLSQADESQKFAQEQRGRTGEFLGRFRTGLTEATQGISQELGLPQLRQQTLGAGQTARQVSQQVRDIPIAQQTIAKQVGISAPRLAQRTAAETAKLSPALETAQRGLQEATSAQQFGEEEFGRRIGQFLQPFQIEAGILGDSVKQEFDLFKGNVKSDLDRELAQLTSKTSLSIADIQNATKLAEIEKATQSGSFTDLGNRVALIDPTTGQELASFNKGKSPGSAVSGIGEWEGA
ncbi:MAG TPA: hypothetical protein ENI23_07180 [bacterium]|nr:hypothetical protein [bacterium]